MYSIKNKGSGKALETTGKKLQQYEWNNTEAQYFKFHSLGADLYNIEVIGSGLYLDSHNKKNIIQFKWDASDTQKFYFNKIYKK